jgi:penicillin G amidase
MSMAGASAQARVLQAETILPPGQSGFVSIPGVANGTGSPHLTDQTEPFIHYQYKSAMFNQPGETETPIPGVKIVRGPYGVPSVTGDSNYHAWWGVGYAVAQDRLFQIELFRRATSGRLAEILGPDYLDDDFVARRDYYTDAEIDAQWAKEPRNLFDRVEGYRDGVNAWTAKVRSDPSLMPGEFPALGIQPVDITARDIGRIGVFLARTIPSGDGGELDNLRSLDAIGSRDFRSILPLRTPGRITSVPADSGSFPSQPGRTRKQERRGWSKSLAFARTLSVPDANASIASANSTGGRTAAKHRPIIPHGGSYMWAMSTAKYTSKGRIRKPGNTYLFNGPQLGYSIPELFVEFEIHSPTQNIRGSSAAGIPLVGIGHNDHIAWGFTSGETDDDDLYAEKLTGPETYTYNGQERKMDCRDERFDYHSATSSLPDLVSGGQAPTSGSQTQRICRTVHGPVQARAGNVAYARKYAIWGRELETLDGLSQLNDAKSVRDVDQAMRNVTWNENVIAADDQGGIGYWHPGLLPLRPKTWDERLPYPGTGEAEWRGLLPRERDPHVMNPAQHYVFNWNNMPSAGWTNGDGGERERLSGPLHRVRWPRLLVRRVARHPSYEDSRHIDIPLTTTAEQRPFFTHRLRKVQQVARGRAREVIDALLRWDGSFAKIDTNDTVDPGVAIWEEFKKQAESLALGHLGAAVVPLEGETGGSHGFDITYGESYSLQHLSARRLAVAAGQAGDVLAQRFGNPNPGSWRDKRQTYDVSAQGAAAPPDLPFFDRGTWEESVALGP